MKLKAFETNSIQTVDIKDIIDDIKFVFDKVEKQGFILDSHTVEFNKELIDSIDMKFLDDKMWIGQKIDYENQLIFTFKSTKTPLIYHLVHSKPKTGNKDFRFKNNGDVYATCKREDSFIIDFSRNTIIPNCVYDLLNNCYECSVTFRYLAVVGEIWKLRFIFDEIKLGMLQIQNVSPSIVADSVINENIEQYYRLRES